MAPQVVFVGAPGSGKSTIAAAVAKHFGLPHIDTDTLVEQRSGMSVSDVFVSQGESVFRQLERVAVVDALGNDEAIVSLGGGAVINADTRKDLTKHRVAWLQVSLSDAATRAGLNQARPLLLGNVRATLAKLLDERTPWYAEVATKAFDTSACAVDQVVEQVVAWLSEASSAPSGSDTSSDDSDRSVQSETAESRTVS